MLRRCSSFFSVSSSSTVKKAIILDGIEVKKVVQAQIANDVEEAYKKHLNHLEFIRQTSRPCQLCNNMMYKGDHHRTTARPTLVMVCVGEKSAPTKVYLENKKRAAISCGFESRVIDFPAEISQEELEAQIQQLDMDPTIHGIIVQRPISPHLNPVAATASVSPIKDVDGLHPSNIGLLHSRNSNPIHVPCTAMAVMRILEFYNVPIVGKRACILGASNIAGRPISELLLSEGATVTTLGRIDSKIVESVVKKADILVTACGHKELVRGHMIKPGAAVLDVGLSPVPDASRPNGYRLVGDVHFEEALQVAGWLTRMPGGVGPVTVSMLLENTLRAYELCVDGFESVELIKAAEEVWRRKGGDDEAENDDLEQAIEKENVKLALQQERKQWRKMEAKDSSSSTSEKENQDAGAKFLTKKLPVEMHHHHHHVSKAAPARTGGPSPTSV